MNQTILIVEDHHTWRKQIARRLEHQYDLCFASSMEEAYSLINEFLRGALVLDLLILDLNLDDDVGIYGGLDILSYLKGKSCSLPCIVISERDVPIDEFDRLTEEYKVMARLSKIKGISRLPEVVHQVLTLASSFVYAPENDNIPTTKLRLFLCHSSDNLDEVKQLYKQLKNDGFQPWLSEESLLPGQDWRREIPLAVSRSDAVLICISKDFASGIGHFQKEARLAIETAKEQPEDAIFIVPIKLEDSVDIPSSLESLIPVNLYEEQGYTRLLKALSTKNKSY